MDTTSTEFTFTLRSRVELEPGHEPIAIGQRKIDRDPTKWRCFCLHLDDHEALPERLPLLHSKPEAAWSDVIEISQSCDISLFIPPGEGSIDLAGTFADPCAFQVWDASNGSLKLIGKPLHRLQAMTMAKRLYRDGGQPVVMTPYLDLDNEWESDEVELEVSL